MTPEERLQHKREYLRKWQDANRERTRELAAKWRAEHPGYNAENSRKQRRDKPEQVRKGVRKWMANNREKMREARKLWEQTPNGREYRKQKYLRRRHRKRAAEGRYTKSDIDRLFAIQEGRCAACRITLEVDGTNRFHVDHIIPLKPRSGIPGTNNPDNLQLLCPPCNISKSNLQPHEWNQRLGPPA